MAWSLHILGTNAAVPVHDRYPSSQALQTDREIFLLDCGEGTQSRLTQFGVKRSKINRIFISHMHGDHIFGLPGLITSYSLFHRKQALHVHGPSGIKSFIESVIQVTDLQLCFPLQIHEHDMKAQTIFRSDNISVQTIPLSHRVPCTGYLFRELVNPRRILKSAAKEYGVPIDQMSSLQAGHDYRTPHGKIIRNEMLTTEGRRPHTYAYCCDTSYFPDIVPLIRDVDLLYHEATFGNDQKGKAKDRGHSTAAEAANIALKAKVGCLLIGHFSSRYIDPSILGEEARQIFTNTLVAKEGLVVDFDTILG